MMYRNLEQEVKEAEPNKIKKVSTKEATEAEARALAQMAAAAEAAARAATAELTAAADRKSITKSYAVAAEATEAPEAQETKGKDSEILVLRKEDDCDA